MWPWRWQNKQVGKSKEEGSDTIQEAVLFRCSCRVKTQVMGSTTRWHYREKRNEKTKKGNLLYRDEADSKQEDKEREREQKWAETWVHLSKRREAQREEKEQKGYDTAEQLRKLSYFSEAVVYSGSDNLTSTAPPHPSSYRRKKESVCNSLSLLSFSWQSFHQTAAEPQIMVQIASFVTFMVMCHIIIKMCHKVSQRGLQGCRLQEWNTENGQRRWCWFFS